MDSQKLVKVRLTVEEASMIASIVKPKPGESFTFALKKYFKLGGLKAQQNDKQENH